MMNAFATSWTDSDGIIHETHPAGSLPDGRWEACEFPERPPTGVDTLYAKGCRACAVAAEARARQSGREVDRIAADKLAALLPGS